MTLLLSASFGPLLSDNYLFTNGTFKVGKNFTSILGFYFSHKISYEVAWFTVSSFRRTPICSSSEKHFKCDFKISDTLFHQIKSLIFTSVVIWNACKLWVSFFCLPFSLLCAVSVSPNEWLFFFPRLLWECFWLLFPLHHFSSVISERHFSLRRFSIFDADSSVS